jgi:hypothetical protein
MQDRAFKKQLDNVQAKNPLAKALDCFKILHRICTNIIISPQRKEYKEIKEKGKIIHKILDCTGGEDLLIRFSKKKIKDFECVFEFEQVDPRVPVIIELYIQIVEKKLQVKMSEKEIQRLYKEKILADIEEDRLRKMRFAGAGRQLTTTKKPKQIQ